MGPVDEGISRLCHVIVSYGAPRYDMAVELMQNSKFFRRCHIITIKTLSTPPKNRIDFSYRLLQHQRYNNEVIFRSLPRGIYYLKSFSDSTG